METFVKIMIILIVVLSIAFFGTMAIDIHNENDMKANAQLCGFWSSAGAQKTCECSGRMTNPNNKINPLLMITGGVDYYCYGECSNCKCYLGFREDKTEVDCSLHEFTENLTLFGSGCWHLIERQCDTTQDFKEGQKMFFEEMCKESGYNDREACMKACGCTLYLKTRRTQNTST